jgi:hypothetical protein
MNVKARVVRILLCIYPSAWRVEYGHEIEGLLLAERLSLSVVRDAIFNAARERVRDGEPRVIFGLTLFVWALCWTGWNSVAPLSPSCYLLLNRFNQGILLLACFATGYWTRRRPNGSIRRSVLAAVNVGFAGIALDMILLVLHSIGSIPLVIVNMSGQAQGRGIALLYTRGIDNMLVHEINFELVLFPVVIGIVASIVGLLGAWSCRTGIKGSGVC